MVKASLHTEPALELDTRAKALPSDRGHETTRPWLANASPAVQITDDANPQVAVLMRFVAEGDRRLIRKLCS